MSDKTFCSYVVGYDENQFPDKGIKDGYYYERVSLTGGGDATLTALQVASQPSKLTYMQGDALDLTGLKINALYGSQKEVTSDCTVSPTNGTKLNTTGSNTVAISYTENEVTKTTSFNVTVESPLKIVTWAGGTDAEIVAMVEAADRGEINLADYWTVGQERKVTLSAMTATGVGESHVAQIVTLVLMNAGGKELCTKTTGGRSTCSFIVGQKNGLSNGTTGEYGYMNLSDTNIGGWNGCARRTWCNSIYYNAIPTSLRPILKKFKNITANGTDSTTVTSEDYFALAAEKEVFGSNTYGNSTAETSLTQFTYYATSSNRIKKTGDSGSAYHWWERSPRSGYSAHFCYVFSDGSASAHNASSTFLLAPFGCI